MFIGRKVTSPAVKGTGEGRCRCARTAIRTYHRLEAGGGAEASTAGIYFCTILEAGSLISRYQRSGFLVSRLSFYEDTGYIGLRPTCMISLYLNRLFKKALHPNTVTLCLRCWGQDLNIWILGGHNSAHNKERGRSCKSWKMCLGKQARLKPPFFPPHLPCHLLSQTSSRWLLPKYQQGSTHRCLMRPAQD